VVTVGGVQYDVTTFTESHYENTNKFQAPANGGVMPWWGNSELAEAFATKTWSAFGSPNVYFGPFFGYQTFVAEVSTGRLGVKLWTLDYQGYTADVGLCCAGSCVYVWAQAKLLNHSAPATSVPGPLPLSGVSAAFGFSRKLRKRIKLPPGVLGSSQPLA